MEQTFCFSEEMRRISPENDDLFFEFMGDISKYKEWFEANKEKMRDYFRNIIKKEYNQNIKTIVHEEIKFIYFNAVYSGTYIIE